MQRSDRSQMSALHQLLKLQQSVETKTHFHDTKVVATYKHAESLKLFIPEKHVCKTI